MHVPRKKLLRHQDIRNGECLGGSGLSSPGFCLYAACGYIWSFSWVLTLTCVMSFRPLNNPLGFPGGSVVKKSVCCAGDAREMGSIPGWGRPLEKEMATHSSILAWRILWTDELGGLQSIGSQKSLTGLSD